MATRTDTAVVNAAGVAQGIVLVTFPAASTVFTNSAEYGLSNSQYGALFLPQVVTAITAALLGGALGGRYGVKRVYLGGLVAGRVSMTLLIVSQFVGTTRRSPTGCFCSLRRFWVRASASACPP
jgi:MFS family permease